MVRSPRGIIRNTRVPSAQSIRQTQIFVSGGIVIKDAAFTHRSSQSVLEDHLAKRKAGQLEEDIAANYAQDVVLLTCTGIRRGHDGVREAASILASHFSGSDYQYQNILVEGEMGFLQWEGNSEKGDIRDGADSYLIREGKIAAQTIYYRVLPK